MTAPASKPLIEKLRPEHAVDDFDCGREELNRFLKRFALTSQQAGSALSYVAHENNIVVGYYSLAVGSVAHADTPARVAKGLAGTPCQ